MKRMTRHAAGLTVALLAAAGACVAAAEPVAAPDAAPVTAVWVEHEVSFVYFGQTTYYSCYGLRDKVRYILRQVGARPDSLKVQVSCVESGGAGIEVMPRVQIKAQVPAPATPERLQALANDPKRQLVARVRGESKAGEAATEPFPASRKVVTFNGVRGDRVEDGDCELLEQLVRQVFPSMDVRVVEGSRLSCMRNQVPVGSVHLMLDTLQKAPEPDAAAGAPRP